jgi:hypothetical protein
MLPLIFGPGFRVERVLLMYISFECLNLMVLYDEYMIVV